MKKSQNGKRGVIVGNIKRITDGAIFLALYAVLLLLFLYVPVIGTIAMFMLPLPFIYYTAKYNWKNGLIFFAGAVGITFIIGTVFALPATFIFGSTGVVFGWHYHEGKTRLSAYLAATTTFLVALVLSFVLYSVFSEINLIEQFTKDVETYTDFMIENMGLIDAATEEMFRQRIELITETFKVLLPSIFLMASALAVILIQLVSIPVLKRIGVKVPDAKPFRELSLPKGFVWFYLAILLISFIPAEFGSFLFSAISNLHNIMQILFIIQGFSFMLYFAYVKGIHKSLPILLFILGLIYPLFFILIQLLGVVDVGFELRKRVKK